MDFFEEESSAFNSVLETCDVEVAHFPNGRTIVFLLPHERREREAMSRSSDVITPEFLFWHEGREIVTVESAPPMRTEESRVIEPIRQPRRKRRHGKRLYRVFENGTATRGWIGCNSRF